jgi:hypothetical protein
VIPAPCGRYDSHGTKLRRDARSEDWDDRDSPSTDVIGVLPINSMREVAMCIMTAAMPRPPHGLRPS